MNKVIFLDIDGVLNNDRYASLMNHLYGGNGFGIIEGSRDHPFKRQKIKWDPYNVGELKTLMQKTAANIVVSSTWRLYNTIYDFKLMFDLYGLKPGKIIGLTPDLSNIGIYANSYMQGFRGTEINSYLEANNVDQYVILDDGNDFFSNQPLVQTDEKYGLTNCNMLEAVEILNV